MIRGPLASQEAAIRNFPERMGEFTAELQAQQTLYKEAKTDLNKLRRDLQRVKQDLASKEEAVQTTVETLEEMRKQFQETEEVRTPRHLPSIVQSFTRSC